MPKPTFKIEHEEQKEPENKIGDYFASGKKKKLEFIKSGSTMLDLSLGGGWPLGKVSNIIGDFSSGKSLLVIEAMTNFSMQYPDGKIFYLEAEAGFDKDYAASLGLPLNKVTFVDDSILEDFTIESWYKHLSEMLNDEELQKQPLFYALDSLDALSDRAEIGRDITEGSFNMTKQKKLGELFRRLTKQVEKSRTHLQIVSQVREAIGITFGNKLRRSGGKALDFYSSQNLWLTKALQVKSTYGKVERITGVDIKTDCKKNKVGLPFRKSQFKIIFGYGIDDTASMLDFLKEVDSLQEYKCPISKMTPKALGVYLKKYKTLDRSDRNTIDLVLKKLCTKKWYEIEQAFLPTFGKYD